MKKNKEEPKSKNYAIILRKKGSMMKTIQILVATAVAGLVLTGCAELKLPELPKVQSNSQTSDFDNIATKKPNKLTKKECEILLKMEKEAREAKKIADEETRVKGRDRVSGDIYLSAANKTAKLQKVYYLTEKLAYCRDIGKEKVNIDIDKIMEINK